MQSKNGKVLAALLCIVLVISALPTFRGAGLTGDIDVTGVEVGENAFWGNYFDSLVV